MALNREYEHATKIPMPVPENTESGDALVIGALPCVALTDRDSDGNATVQTDGAYRFNVKGVAKSGNAVIAAGAVLYLQTNGDINSNTDGARYGYALAGVGSGATTEIAVKVGY